MQATDQDISLLITGCLANNRKAQEQLYRLFYGFALRIALRYSRDDMDAADIMSRAFVKVFKSIHTYDSSKGSMHAWIKRIVVNEGLDHIKARSRFSKDVELEEAEAPYIDNSAIINMDADAILELVQKLPPATHAVFVLYAIEGYSHKEVAARLEITEGTSKWHLSEARKFLQKNIQQIYSG